MDLKKKNNLALYILGGVLLLCLVIQLIVPGAWFTACVPFFAAMGSAFVLVAMYRFVLIKDLRTAIASFVTPIVLAWATPIWILFFLLFSQMPTGKNSEMISTVFMPIVSALCLFAVPIIGVVLSVLSIIKSAVHLRAAIDTETRLISELPMLISVVGSGITIGVIAFFVFNLMVL
ncbi:MAG: hypothetical protein RSC01_00720 [Oscillospiraceae bacterium]